MRHKGSSPAVLYAAKSTEDKHGSIPDQLVKTRRLAKAEDWDPRGEFTDEGFSAYSGNRGPSLEEAKAAAIALAASMASAFWSRFTATALRAAQAMHPALPIILSRWSPIFAATA